MGSGSPSASVDISVRRSRKVEVDDMFDVGNIQTSRSDVCRDENTVGRGFESEKSALVLNELRNARNPPIEIL